MPTDYRSMIAALSFPNQAFIDGRHAAAASGRTFDCLSPIDGRLLTRVPDTKHVSLETGGKSPNIVFADSGELERIARHAGSWVPADPLNPATRMGS